jgi:opacity protein-like surface antigen
MTSTALRFSGSLHADETRAAALARLAYSVSPDVTLHVGAGSAFGGHLTLPDGVHEFSPGVTGQLGASWQVLSRRPFVILTSLLSFSAATTQLQGTEEAIGYEAFDLRLGGIAGFTLLDILSPYVLARVFGGPVYWHYQGQAVTGTDVSHYQVGAGVAVAVARRMEVFAEGVPLGERALAAGVSLTF